MRFHNRVISWLWLSTLVVGLDQGTKALAELYLNPLHPMSLLPFCNLVLVHNDGAAFSILHNAGGWQRYFLIAITIVVLVLLVRWLRDIGTEHLILAAGLAMIIGGAFGNLIDRVINGTVVDFIGLYYAAWHWPAFNIADAAISIGVGFMLVDVLFFSGGRKVE